MEIVGYYDGTGKSDPRNGDKYLTLAGYAGTTAAWAFLKERRSAVLARWNADRGVAPVTHVHMYDAHHLRRDFSRERGWNHEKVRQLQNELHNESLAPTCWEYQTQFVGASCTVNLEDFRRAVAERPHLPVKYRDPESICVWQVLLKHLGLFVPAGERAPLPPDANLKMHFDQGETFLAKLHRVWQERKHEAPFKYIDEPQKADSRATPELQLADMIAWDAHLAYNHDDPVAAFEVKLSVIKRHLHSYCTYETACTILDRAMAREQGRGPRL